MSDKLASLYQWLVEPLPADVSSAVERLRCADDVCHVAIMPDVHLATNVCVGTVMATTRLLYPGAVGGDIGCGMLAVAFDVGAQVIADPAVAARVLTAIGRAVPASRRHRARAVPWPEDLPINALSHPSLQSVARSEGALQLGTLGSGNHFIELQADEEDRLWLMIHSGSRAMGQAIRDLHVARATPTGFGLRALDAETEAGQAYAADLSWARTYANANRRGMADAVTGVLHEVLGASALVGSLVTCDHNHAAREEHGGRMLWVHRKGAMPAPAHVPGLLPGSMGTLSYHVEGRGCPESLNSSAHGAGRALSREAARRRITPRQLCQQMDGVWFDYRLAGSLRDEAPSAYKDIRAVLRAQHDLVRVTRTLRPLLCYKSG